MLAETLQAFGATFGNGAIDAWAFDALDRAGFTGSKDRIFSRQFQIVRITGMSGALVGAYVVQGDIATQRIVVHEGGEVNGRVKMGEPEAPDSAATDDARGEGPRSAVGDEPEPPHGEPVIHM